MPLVWDTIAPEVKGKRVFRARERAKVNNGEANRLRGDKELERASSKVRNTKVSSTSSNGGLEDMLTEEESRQNLQRERAKDCEEDTGEEMGRPRERATLAKTDSPGAKESPRRVGRTMASKGHTARSSKEEEGGTYRITGQPKKRF